jgi:transcriptional regulator with XRE-family HTH domain
MDQELIDRRETALAAQIRFVRSEQHITQRAVWEQTKIGRSSYLRIESGKKSPTATELYLIAQVLGVTDKDLLDGTDARLDGRPIETPNSIRQRAEDAT